MNFGNGLLLLLVGGCFFLMMKRGGGCCGGRHTESNSCHRVGDGSSDKTVQEERNRLSGEQASANPEPHKGNSNKGALASLALAAVLALGTYSPVWANAAHHLEESSTQASMAQSQESVNSAASDEIICKEKCTGTDTQGKKETKNPVMPKVGEMNSMTGASPMMGTMMNRKQGMETVMDICKMMQQTETMALPETKSH